MRDRSMQNSALPHLQTQQAKVREPWSEDKGWYEGQNASYRPEDQRVCDQNVHLIVMNVFQHRQRRIFTTKPENL